MKTSTGMAIPLALAAAGASEPALAQQSLFLQLDGIQGESTVQNHVDQIEVLAWSWNLSRATAQGSVPVVREIKVSKQLDKASLQLMNALITGAKIGKGSLFLHTTGKTQPFDPVELEMQNVFITKVALGIDDLQTPQTETIGLSFDNICFKYRMVEGGALEEQCWDVSIGGKL